MSSAQRSASATRRALRRAADLVSLDVTEASILLAARGADLDQQCRIAGHVRDQGLATAGLPGLVTYSRKVFIPLTRRALTDHQRRSKDAADQRYTRIRALTARLLPPT